MRQRFRYEALWMVIGRGAVAVASLASVRVFTALMPPALYGRYALLLGITALVNTFLISPVAHGMNRLFHDAANAGVLKAFLWRGIAASSLLALLGGVIGFPVLWFYVADEWHWWVTATLAVVAVLAGNLRDRETGSFNMLRWRGRYVLLAATDAWLRVAAIALGLRFIGPSLPVVAGGLAASALMAAVLGLPWLLQIARNEANGQPKTGRFEFSRLYVFARPLFVVTLCGWALSISDRYILGRIVSAADLGRYVAGYQVATAAFGIVTGVFFPIVSPLMFQQLANSPERSIDLSPYVLAVTVPTVMLTAIPVVDIEGASKLLLSNRQFDTGDTIIPLVSLGMIFQAMQCVAEHQAHFTQRTHQLISVYGLAAITNIALNFLLAPTMGIAAGAISTCVSYFVHLGSTVAVCRPRITSRAWLRTGALVVVGALFVVLARTSIPSTMPTVPRAALRWSLFLVTYGAFSAFLLRRDAVGMRTSIAQLSAGGA